MTLTVLPPAFVTYAFSPFGAKAISKGADPTLRTGDERRESSLS
jgi:hypothetical protein